MDPVTKHLLEVAEKVMTDLVTAQNKQSEVVVDGLVKIVVSLNDAMGTLSKTIENLADIAGKSLRGEIKDDHHSRDVVETIVQRWVKGANDLVGHCHELAAPVIKVSEKE